MGYQIKQLIDGQEITCIRQDASVAEALSDMTANDFSQLPVVDTNGKLVGLISEQTIVRRYHMSGGMALFDSKVSHCMTGAGTIPASEDVFEAVALLENSAAVVVVDGERPTGIVTHYDTTNFFRNVSEGLMYVEDVELKLREIIEGVYPDKEDSEDSIEPDLDNDFNPQLTRALFEVFGTNRRNPNQPGRTYERFTFNDYIEFIAHESNWPQFEDCLEVKPLFRRFMQIVRDIRNQIAHFRGDLTPLQFRQLSEAKEWLFARPTPAKRIAEPLTVAEAQIEYGVSTSGQVPPDGGMAHLQAWLNAVRPNSKRLDVEFVQLEEVLGVTLPPSARKHRSWWSNNSSGHPQAAAWLRAGWLVDTVDFSDETVSFKRTKTAYYEPFFRELAQRMQKQRPGLVQTDSVRPKHWLSFDAGVPGLSFAWAFGHQRTFRAELYIDTGDKNLNEQYFQQLKSQQGAIQKGLSEPLIWELLPDRRASRVKLETKGDVTDSPNLLGQLTVWAADNMLVLADAFTPFLGELESE